MSNFFYKGQKSDGSITKGTLSASSKPDAVAQLGSLGITPFVLEEVKQKTGANTSLSMIFKRVSVQEKMVFTKNLAGMLEAGLALHRALSILEKQTKNDYFKSVITGLMDFINQGKSLSEALQEYPKVFSALFVAMVQAGEESGGLVSALHEIEINLEKSYQLRRRIKGAMTYPSIIIGAVILIGTLMFIFVIPTLTNVFKEFELELPFTTKLVILVSDFASAHPILILGGLVAITGGGFYALRKPELQPAIDRALVKIPVISGMIKETNTARTARTMSSLLSAGVSIGRALEITENVIQNTVYKTVVAEANERVQKGEPLSGIFKERLDIYPVMFGEMIEVGEETGNLPKMFFDVAVFYEQEVEDATKNLSTIIEPILMVFIGAGVGFFAVSMIQPMYSLVQGFQ